MFEYLVNKPNYCHTSTFVYKTLESKIAIRKGRVRFKGRVEDGSLPALDSAGSGESGRADSSKDWGDGNLVECKMGFQTSIKA